MRRLLPIMLLCLTSCASEPAATQAQPAPAADTTCSPDVERVQEVLGELYAVNAKLKDENDELRDELHEANRLNYGLRQRLEAHYVYK